MPQPLYEARSDPMIIRLINIAGISTLVTVSFIDWLPTVSAVISGVLGSFWAILLIGEWFGFWSRPRR